MHRGILIAAGRSKLSQSHHGCSRVVEIILCKYSRDFECKELNPYKQERRKSSMVQLQVLAECPSIAFATCTDLSLLDLVGPSPPFSSYFTVTPHLNPFLVSTDG